MSTTLDDFTLAWTVGGLLTQARAIHRTRAYELERLEVLYAKLALHREKGQPHTEADEDEFNDVHGELYEAERQFKVLVAQLYAITGDEILSG